MMKNMTGETDKKIICFFSGDITREGGTENVAALIANALARQKKYEIIFLSLVERRDTPFFPICPEIRRYRLGEKWIQPGPGYLAVLPKLKRFLRERRVDVLVDIDIVLDSLSIPVKGSGTKVVSWGHFSYFYEQKSLYRRLIQMYAAKKADYCVTINEENRKCYERYLHRTKALRTIYNPAVMEKRQDAVAKENYIFWAGRLVRIKGVDYLAETADRVLKLLPGWRWLAAGDGEEREWLETYIREHGLQDRLVLLGTVADIGQYYAKARIHVLTSREEGLPMCLLEAKSHGLPCVSFNISTGPEEIIRDGVNGYLVEPFDCEKMAEKIVRLASDEELRERFALNAGLDMEKFDLNNIINSWNEVFESLCG